MEVQVKMVSVIVSIYNVEDSLRRFMCSILNQSYYDFELILVDNGSVDHSSLMCDSYTQKDDRVRVYHIDHCDNAWYVGLEQAKGDFVIFCTCCGQYDCDFLLHMVDSIEKNHSDLVICNYYKKKGSGFLSCFSGESRFVCKEEVFKDLFLSRGEGYFLWNKIFRRDMVDDICLPEGLQIYEDVYFMSAAVEKAERIYYLCKELFFFTPPGAKDSVRYGHLISPHHTSKYSDAFGLIIRDMVLPERVRNFVRCEIFRHALMIKYGYRKVKEQDRAFAFSLNRDIAQNVWYFLKERYISFEQKIDTFYGFF